MKQYKKIKVSNTGGAVKENLEIDWSKHEELKTLVKPLVDFLRKHYNPHCQIIISDSFVKVTSDEIGVPFEIED